MMSLIYNTGDWLVHTFHGVGQVLGLDEKEMDGEMNEYLKVETFNGIYWLSMKNIDTRRVRPVSAMSTFKNALDTIREKPEKMTEDFRARIAQITAVIRDGSLIRLARLIRDLSGKFRTTRLTHTEEEYFIDAKKRFVNEYSMAADLDRNEAEKKLRKALENSASKLPQTT
jgi:RNA polymerase-interacting CarD/CdnL/TRCF family regulator